MIDQLAMWIGYALLLMLALIFICITCLIIGAFFGAVRGETKIGYQTFAGRR